jgi:hypothetical protein
MLRKAPPILACALVVSVGLVRGQAPVKPMDGMESGGRLFGFHNPHTTVRPNSDGTFEFFGQPPGTYVLSAGLEILEDGKRRHLMTYFPGTRDLAAAVPIVIGKATEQDGFVFAVATK